MMSINMMARVGSLAGRGAIKCSPSWHQAPLITENVCLAASCRLLQSLGSKRFQADSSICSRRLFFIGVHPGVCKILPNCMQEIVQVDVFVVTAVPQLRIDMFTL